MKKLNYPILILVLLLASRCNNAETKKVETETIADTTQVVSAQPTAPAPVVDEPIISTYKTKTGKIFTVTESHPTGASLSNITIQFNGTADSTKMEYKDVDPVNKIVLYDLDSDGFEEIYIVTVSAGSGSGANVYALASNKDKSVSQIYFPPIEESDLKKGGNFEGYEGHDDIELIENSLLRTFPIKSEKAKTRAVNYKMKKGEAGFVLFIKNSTAY